MEVALCVSFVIVFSSGFLLLDGSTVNDDRVQLVIKNQYLLWT